MNINDAFPSKYLKAADLQEREIPVVIGRIEMETLGTDRRMLIYFNGKEKALVCNITNAKNIAKGYGQNTDGWIGKTIVLFEAMVDFKGESVPAIRVKMPKVAAGKQLPKKVPEPEPEGDGSDLDDDIPF